MMNFKEYQKNLKISAVRNLLIIGILARIPHAAANMALMLHVTETMGMNYGEAGLVVTAITVGIAVGSPWRGRLLDTRGLKRTVIPSIIVELLFWTVSPWLPYPILVIGAFIGGVMVLPVFPIVRKSLSVIVSPQQRRTVYALDSISTELVFMIGPASGILLAHSPLGTGFTLIVIGLAVSLSGLLLLWFKPPLGEVPEERAKSSEKHTRTFKSWLNRSVISVLVVTFGTGMLLQGTDMGLLAMLRELHQEDSLWVVFIFWCGASLIGGLIYGAFHRVVSSKVLLALMAVCTIPVALGTDYLMIAWLAILAGLFCAPTLSASSEQVAQAVPAHRRGEAMGLFSSALTLGSAVGVSGTGHVIDVVGAGSGFMMVACAALGLAILGLLIGLGQKPKHSSSAIGNTETIRNNSDIIAGKTNCGVEDTDSENVQGKDIPEKENNLSLE